jgi:hypothetical protein
MRAPIRELVVAGLAACLVLGCGAGKPSTSTDGDTDGEDDGYEVPPDRPDADGDTISDEDEGRFDHVDTDGDGTEDWEDDDSDGDTIPDSIEAGDEHSGTPPRDGDLDGTPDFRDLDSDDNGIPDESDSTEDIDADGILDFSDIDDDNDSIDDVTEIGGDPEAPEDFDGDTTPDYRDEDSDDDLIRDLDESRAGGDFDFDEDTIPDRHDDDTDGDGWTDTEEAGDDDPSTPPVNTDGDEWPDFRDLDSDADGLSDEDERAAGTSRTNEDTDGDGVSDLIEVGYGSNPTDPTDSPRSHGDFVFKVPYNDPTDPPDPPLDPEPLMDTLVFSTDLQHADVFFLVDTTGSMGGEITNLRTSLSDYIIPQIQAVITDVWFGVGAFDDYPESTYGTTGDLPFYLLQRMTSSTTDAQTAVNSLSVHDGEDLPESTIPALWATATGGALGTYVPAQDACTTTESGYPCFRSGAVPIVVLITDAAFHNDKTGSDAYSGITPTPPNYADTVTELTAINAKVTGVWSGSGPEVEDLNDIARDTGAVYEVSAGVFQPLVAQIFPDGSYLGDRVVLNVQRLANQTPIEISTAARDLDEGSWDTVDATGFIDRIVPNTTGGVEDPMHPGVFCVPGLSTADRSSPPDGIDDVFTGVLPGTTVCFDIYPIRNDIVPATEEVQIYQAEIDVIGDGYTVLDTRSVFFLIPPEIEEPILS